MVGAPTLGARETYRLYSDLIDLTDRALEEIRSTFPAGNDSDHADELRNLEQPISALRDSLFSYSPKSPVKVILQHEPGQLLALAATTSRMVGQHDPSTEKLREASDQLRAILKELIDSDMPPSLKEALRQGIERLLRMIDHYAIFGPDGVVMAVGELTGQLSVRGDARDPESTSLVATVLNRVSEAVTIVTGVVQLGQLAYPLVQRMLGGSGSGAI